MKDTPQSLLEDVKNNLPLLYDVDEDYQVSLLKYSENIIYKVEFSKSSPVVFRIHRPGYHDIEELEGEIRWMDEIHKDTQVRLPVVYRGRDGGFLQKMRTSGGNTALLSPFYMEVHLESLRVRLCWTVLKSLERLQQDSIYSQ